MKEYYVYALVDPIDNSIFYIGKGKRKRYLAHVKQFQKLESENYIPKEGMNPSKLKRIKKIISSGMEVIHKIIA
jgi:hypothetical protein